jgi:phosphohistidine phosphatase
MRIYLFRHGEALSKSDPSVSSDPQRPLIEEGIRRTRLAAEALAKFEIPFDAVYTSPWVRAKQTAKIVCEVLGLNNVLHEMDELAGDRAVEDVMNALAKQSRHEEIILVGHNPLLSDIASYLLALSQGMQVDLKKSGICAVETDRVPPKNPGTLLWAMTNKQLRMIR